MSASTRRRSRGPYYVGTPSDTKSALQQASHPFDKLKTHTITVVTLVVIALLLACFLLGSDRSAIFISSPSHPVSNGDHHILHPEDHVSREATTHKHRWRISKGLRRPDGVLKEVYLINDAFPGPTLEARSGDRVVVEVENALQNEGVALHWHGLSMRGSNAMDGAVGITQNCIQPGSTFIYDFMIENGQHGTFWYHAHEQVQRGDGLFGGFVVHEPGEQQSVGAEWLLLVGDWYHRSATDALEFYMHPGSFGNEPVPDSVLLNGYGAFICGDAVLARPLDCKQHSSSELPVLELDGAQSTTFRVVNVGSYAGFEFSIDNARLTPLRSDGGHRVSGQSARRMGHLEPGQRVDLQVDLIGTIQSTKPPAVEVVLDISPFKYPNPALTPTHRFPVLWQNNEDSTTTRASGTLEYSDVQSLEAIDDQSAVLPQLADIILVLYTITQKLSHLRNEPHGFINNTSWKPQEEPLAPLIAVDRELWDKNQFIPKVHYEREKPLWVDIVLNNLDEEAHPFHLHGYDFWVLSTYSSTYNWGSYNPFEDEEAPGGQYNVATPAKKDTVLVPRRGYAVLRLRADNPGIWMFHCHNVGRGVSSKEV